MKPETAKALHELAKAAAKSLGFEGENLVITVCDRKEEVPMNETPNYLAAIESEFSRIRGKWSPLSPMDWQLADSWEQKGIPLHVVLNAMSEVFRKFESSKKSGKINGLSYFTQEVESKFAEWSELQIGKADESEDTEEDVSFGDEIICRLETIYHAFLNNIFDCPETLREILSKTLSVVRNLRDEDDPERIESVLESQKTLLNEAIIKYLSETNDDYYEFTPHRYNISDKRPEFQHLMLVKKFRDKYNLPDLTLYEL